MGLTYWGFVGVHIGCGVGILIITGLILALLMRYSHSIYGFFMNHMLGVELEYDTESDSSIDFTIKIDKISFTSKKGRSLRAFFLWFIGTATLTVALMVLFEGCILGSAAVYFGDPCPDDPMTCFTAVGSFQCVPGSTTVFPSGANSVAWCYGWIVTRQTVSKVINQVGICGGILGVTGTLFAFMFRAGGREGWPVIIWIVVTVISLLIVPTMIIIAFILNIAFSVLAYLVAIEITLLFLTVFIFTEVSKDSSGTISTRVPAQITPVSN